MKDLMARCPSCSREFTEAGRFCPWCATPVDASSAETAVLPPAVSAPPSASHPVLAASSAVDEGRFLPGTLLASRYRIAGLLGRGGMGEVDTAVLASAPWASGQLCARGRPEATTRSRQRDGGPIRSSPASWQRTPLEAPQYRGNRRGLGILCDETRHQRQSS